MSSASPATACFERDVSPPRKRLKIIAGPSTSTAKETITIYSWNINGIAPFLQTSIASFTKVPEQRSRSASLRDFLRHHNWPEVVHLQEVKISRRDERTCRAVQRAVNIGSGDNSDGPTYEVHFCLPEDKHNAKRCGGKVYGVASIIRDDFAKKHVERVRKCSWDSEGRVLVVELRCKIAIWNIYAVNGTTNPYRDSESGETVGTRHDRKLMFHRLLLEECKELEMHGWKVVVCGDLNVARAPIDGHPRLRTSPEQHVRNRQDFNEKFFEEMGGLKLIDTFRYLHPEGKKYTWIATHRPWLSSCDRVDYILISRSFEDNGAALAEADIAMTELDRGPSDHVPIWIVLNIALDA